MIYEKYQYDWQGKKVMANLGFEPKTFESLAQCSNQLR